MPLELPVSLSPSKVTAFRDCPMAFRFSVIDQIPEPPSVPATKGTLVHKALELLFEQPAPLRTPTAALGCLDTAWDWIQPNREFTGLQLSDPDSAAFFTDAARIVRTYFELEDPTTIHPIGLELKLEATVGSLKLRGIIDRLERDPSGDFIVTDYKTGKPPNERREAGKLGGVQFYALLIEQVFGKIPAKIQLLYVGTPLAIVATPTEQSVRGTERKTAAVWQAVEKACLRDDFRPNPGPLCSWCSFKQYCPAFGGDPSSAPKGAAA